MAIDERARLALYQRLELVLGPDEAVTMMSYLPPQGWGEIATKGDLALLRGDVERLRAEFGGLRVEFEDLRAEVRAELHEFRAELHEFRAEMSGFRAEMSGFRAELTGFKVDLADLRVELHRTLRVNMFSLVGFMVALAAAQISAVALLV
jgi:hypothetical protein